MFSIPTDVRNLSTFTFLLIASFVSVVGWNIGNITRILLTQGFSYGFIVLLIVSIILELAGLFYLVKIIPVLRKREKIEDKLQEEKVVSEILDQDIKLLTIKNLELDYNFKVSEWNKENPSNPKSPLVWRDMESIAKQVLNSNFYEVTYSDRILNKKATGRK